MRLSSADPKSVVVILDLDSKLRVSGVTQSAQSIALKNKLPLAVVVRHDPGRELDEAIFDELEKLELQLAYYAVPLILMFGTEAAVLKALQKHFEPDIYRSDDTPGSLIRHGIKWPWAVQPVKVLRRYVAKVGLGGVCEL